MLFNSIEFIIFLPVVFALYWLLARHLRWQNLLVVAASYLFYGWWDWRFLLLIAFTTLCSYLSGLAIGRTVGAAAPEIKPSRARIALVANLVVNLSVLGLFKYYDFFVQSFADAFLDGRTGGMLLHWVLPVGISFYTFQALSYSIDVYRRDIRPTRDLVAFVAYVSFFPQLVAGPIERAASLLPQFHKARRFDYAQAVDGLRQMVWGFFKKLVLADSCALYVDEVFAHPDWYSASSLALAAVLFSLQIYGDFSGYSDIAIGCAKLFGIKLRRNFNVPYFSRDIAEFWRRWHISLTTWFRDYIYIPLGGSRVPKWRVVVNTMVIFLVSGLWHGANWTFVVWGAFHAVLFMPLILLGRNRRYRDVVASDRALPTLRELGQMAGTFLLATLGWVVFRADSMSDALFFFQHLFRASLFKAPNITASIDAWILVVAISLLTVVEWVNRREEHEFARLPHNIVLRWLLYVAIVVLIGTCMVTNEMPFIYFQF